MNPKNMILNLRKKGAHRSCLYGSTAQNTHDLFGRVGSLECKNLSRIGMGLREVASHLRTGLRSSWQSLGAWRF